MEDEGEKRQMLSLAFLTKDYFLNSPGNPSSCYHGSLTWFDQAGFL